MPEKCRSGNGGVNIHAPFAGIDIGAENHLCYWLSMPINCGVEFPKQWTPFMQELFLFYYGNQLAERPYERPSADGSGWKPCAMPYEGEGRFQHFQKIVRMVFPKSFEWHEWSEKAARAMCDNKRISICGCGGSGKSTTAAMYALVWWLVDPSNSAVLIASTTIEQAKKRIWKNIRQYYTEFVKVSGSSMGTKLMGNPKPHIRAPDTKLPDGTMVADSSHGIFVVAVAKGEEQKGIDNLKGFHPKRLMMIGDETDSIGQAVVDVGVNQEIGTLEYQQVWLGNDPSLFNPLGKMMQPEFGRSVGLSDVEWTSVLGVACLRFDGFASPNIRDGDKWSGIIRKKDIDVLVKEKGENHPQVWIMIRGIHPPEGADDTVLSEALFMRNRCQDGVTWKRSFILSGLLDPAFGGDRCVFRTMARGNDMENKMRVLFGPPQEIHIDASDTKNPPEYQIAQKVKTLCKAQGIPPNEFTLDGTGTGRGVAAVLQREWSPNINVCQFGGACSDLPVSDEEPKEGGRPRLASEEYDRRVTELWYSMRVFVEAEMIRGLDPETAAEFCSRKFFIKAKKTAVETKTEMKERGAKSPDLADCCVVGIDHLRRLGINATVTSEVKQEAYQDWSSKLSKHDLDGGKTYQPAIDEPMEVGYAMYF